MENVINIDSKRDVAAAINLEYELSQQDATSAVEHAIKCGDLLLAQKRAMKHGEFMPWVKANCCFSHFAAVKYMRASEKANLHGHANFASIAALLSHSEGKPPKTVRQTEKPASCKAILDDLDVPEGGTRAKIKADASQIVGFSKIETHEQEQAFRAAALQVIAQRAPEKLPEIAKLREQIPETQKERFDRLLRKSTEIEYARLRSIFNDQLDAKVKEIVGRRTSELAQEEQKLKEARTALYESAHDIVTLISEHDAKIITGCLHPDRPDRTETQLRKAFVIWTRVVERRTFKHYREVLRKNGWSK